MKFKLQPNSIESIGRETWIIELDKLLRKQSEKSLELFKKNKRIFWAMHGYKGSYFDILNRKLRMKNYNLNDIPELQELDNIMQNIMHMQLWKFDDIVLYRTLDGTYANKIKTLKVGDTFTNDAYSSTAFEVKYSLDFGKCDVLLIIKPKKGSPFLYIDGYREDFCNKRENKKDSWVFQTEIVLNRGTTFKITKKIKKPLEYFFTKDLDDCVYQWFNISDIEIIYVDMID
jgi:hypothetical protein